MSTTTPSRTGSSTTRAQGKDRNKVTMDRLMGNERRWRRFGAPVAAGASRTEDGEPDYGIFGPGSAVWDVVLHPSTTVFHHAAQQLSQDVYKPIKAGIRDGEPIVRKAEQGTFSMFHAWERHQRGAAMHLPMWLGDSKTARSMAAHLHRIHTHVAGDVIDTGDPSLGGYAAAEPRESLWAGITELHPMLRVYEAFAFRGRFGLPRRLDEATRDRFVAEMGEYLRLHGAPEEDIPSTVAELAAVYAKYDHLFGHSPTISIRPSDGRNYEEMLAASSKANMHPSQFKILAIFALVLGILRQPVLGALPSKTREGYGFTPGQHKRALLAAKAALPLAWVLQQPPVERRLMTLLWGQDGTDLILSARKLHAEALARREAATPATRATPATPATAGGAGANGIAPRPATA